MEVLQVVKMVREIEKQDYTPETQKALEEGASAWSSRVGYVEEGTLFLPTERQSEMDQGQAEVVILQDIPGFDPDMVEKAWDKSHLPSWYADAIKRQVLATNRQFFCFGAIHQPWRFEIFNLDAAKNGSFSLHLNYSLHQLRIGLPQRENHKVAVLLPNETLRYRINGKSDDNWTSPQQQIFIEHDYVIQHLGKAERVEYRSAAELERTKNLPTSGVRTVDERTGLK